MITEEQVAAAYAALVSTLHPTDQICFNTDAVRLALEAACVSSAVDTHSQSVEIRIAQHPDGIRVWVHVGGELEVRVYRVPPKQFALDDMRAPEPPA